jgi:acyl dehydratase
MIPGDRIPELRRRIDLPTLVRYAGASGDFNRVHYDEAYTRAAGLDGVIGHGWLALALVSQP